MTSYYIECPYCKNIIYTSRHRCEAEFWVDKRVFCPLCNSYPTISKKDFYISKESNND